MEHVRKPKKIQKSIKKSIILNFFKIKFFLDSPFPEMDSNPNAHYEDIDPINNEMAECT